MSTRISAAALLDTTTITIGYLTLLVSVVLCGLVIVGVRLYRNQKERGGESDRFSAELSEAVWPSTQYPEANAKLASTLRSTKPRDLAATIAAELDRR
ncbi:hypothetical protein [Mycolicibacterium goodii]|uniref:Uncharacterized protein n=1 Tax=Mycolicibacterium goodii TaxID=134601 RepID=A0ABS6HV07_MYCGD|nr:hypothetical protein [Mycolicibacterium goodii]MBU8826516.1 hypothetical protein [Mycolicibacterium goodii]